MNLLDLIFPKRCLECNRDGRYLCDDCISKVRLLNTYGSNYSVFKYEGVIRKAIISLKYKFTYDVSQELTERILEKIKNNNLRYKNIALVPIPLYKQRENWRGFNQSELIGEKIAKRMNWKYIPDLLLRTKKTDPQVGLKGSVRRSNLSGVFTIRTPYIQYTKYNILIFDDVYTTGSTINEAKKVLSEAGFNDIKSLTIAR